jgi:tRNA A37 threonylcarbamoyladenosine synthetase subunit TsaC/SUA5/YrdC
MVALPRVPSKPVLAALALAAGAALAAAAARRRNTPLF